MKNIFISSRHFFSVVLTLVCVARVSVAQETILTSKLLKGSSISTNASIENITYQVPVNFQSTVFQAPLLKVELVYEQNNLNALPNDFWDLDINFDVTSDENTSTLVGSGALSLNYGGEGAQTLNSVRYFDLAIGDVSTIDAKYSLNLTALTFLRELASAIPEEVVVKFSIVTNNFYLNPSLALEEPQYIQFNHNTNIGNSTISWKAVPNATHYELEWTFIDHFDSPNHYSTASPAFEAVEGASIITNSNSFPFELTYPEGELYFRVRSIASFPNSGSKRYSPWQSRNQSQYTDPFEITSAIAFEQKKNWQVNHVFAENGKNKTVVGYYDGSLRNRQTITDLSTSGNIVVGESLIDYEGRPTLGIMPTVIDGTSNSKINLLSYHNELNMFDTDNGLSKEKHVYDKVIGDVDPMSTNSGTAKYYSQANDVSGIHQDMTPNAEGYVYSRTTFKNDATGRPTKQRGVGETFSKNEGHISSFYYENVDDGDLKRLFGSNVGNANKYRKTYVSDPNGQLTVSYTDLQGRTIASGLAGKGPDNLLEIEGNEAEDVTKHLLNAANASDNNVLNEETNALEMTNTIMNDAVGKAYNFNYDLTGTNAQLDGICSDCNFELVMTIVDPNGTAVAINTNNTYGDNDFKIIQSINGNGGTCETETITPSISFSTDFSEIGSYTINKSLRVTNGDITQIKDFLENLPLESSPPTGFPDFNNIYDNVLAGQDPYACEFDCDNLCHNIALDQGHVEGSFAYDEAVLACKAENCPTVDQVIEQSVIDRCEDYKHSLVTDYKENRSLFDIINTLYDNSGLIEHIPDEDLITKEKLFSYWETPSWDNTLARDHQEYCVYTNVCGDVYDDVNSPLNLRRADAYGLELSTLTSFEEAARQGNFYPLGDMALTYNFITDLYEDVAVIDPLIIQLPQDLKIGLGTEFNNYEFPSETTPSSFGGQTGLYGFIEYMYDKAKAVDETVSPDMKVSLFSAVYGTMRNKYIDLYLEGKCTDWEGDVIKKRYLNPDQIEAEYDKQTKVDISEDQALVDYWSGVWEQQCPDMAILKEDDNTIAEYDQIMMLVRGQLAGYFHSQNELNNPFSIVVGEDIVNEPSLTVLNNYLKGKNLSTPCSLSSIAQSGVYKEDCSVTGDNLSNAKKMDAILLTIIQVMTDLYNNGNYGAIINLASPTSEAEYAIKEMAKNLNWISPDGISMSFGVFQMISEGAGEGFEINVGINNWGAMSPLLPQDPCDQCGIQNTPFNGNLETNLSKYSTISSLTATPNHTSTNSLFHHKGDPDTEGYGTINPNQAAICYRTPYGEDECGCAEELLYGINNIDITFNHDEYYGETSLGASNPICTNQGYQALTHDNTLTTILTKLNSSNQLSEIGLIAIEKVAQTSGDIHNIFSPYTFIESVYVHEQFEASNFSETVIKEHSHFYETGLRIGDFVFNVSSYSVVIKELQGDGTYEYHDCYLMTSAPNETMFNVCPPSIDVTYLQLEAECADNEANVALTTAKNLYDNVIGYYASAFSQRFNKSCLDNTAESFYYNTSMTEYQYTLYYYNQAGNLVQTVPPAGVDIVDRDGTVEPQHRLVTQYEYDNLGNLIWQHTPDGGNNRFWYDDKGQLRLSQNAQQLTENRYSYVDYDALGRPTEAGTFGYYGDQSDGQEYSFFQQMLDKKPYENGSYNELLGSTKLGQTKKLYDDRVYTFYDATFAFTDLVQTNLRNRISAVATEPATGTKTATVFSYDAHGNVNQLEQTQFYGETPSSSNNFRVNIEYHYDLISGNVNQVDYQKGEKDQFSHRYEYDADNRLTNVETSTDGYVWVQEAKYHYYAHGPLARIELGDELQGMDYYYNLQGWIKGINTPAGLNQSQVSKDFGEDGLATEHQTTAQDAFAYSLHYFQNDYAPLGVATASLTTTPWVSAVTDRIERRVDANDDPTTYTGLYNGNIAMMTQQVHGLTDLLGDETLPQNYGMRTQAFSYDQLNRIKAARSIYTGSNGSFINGNDNLLASNYSYDQNGNITALDRKNEIETIDDFNYNYNWENNDPTQFLLNNQLTKVTKAGNGDYGNYAYDEIGNLTSELGEDGVTLDIEWNASGKVKKITKTTGEIIQFSYNAFGNRIEKHVKASDGSFIITYYTHDAAGNVMGTYKRGGNGQGGVGSRLLEEQPIYGSSRLGVRKPHNQNLSVINNYGEYVADNRFYELSNHLGNVMAVVSDAKHIQTDNGNTYFKASLEAANDYYPFGAPIAERTAMSDEYRYGFNGAEKDDEVANDGEHYDLGFRHYDPKIARMFSLDPLAANYPSWSPYQYAANSPISIVDVLGLGPGGGHTDEEKLNGEFKGALGEKTFTYSDGLLLDDDGFYAEENQAPITYGEIKGGDFLTPVESSSFNVNPIAIRQEDMPNDRIYSGDEKNEENSIFSQSQSATISESLVNTPFFEIRKETGTEFVDNAIFDQGTEIHNNKLVESNLSINTKIVNLKLFGTAGKEAGLEINVLEGIGLDVSVNTNRGFDNIFTIGGFLQSKSDGTSIKHELKVKPITVLVAVGVRVVSTATGMTLTPQFSTGVLSPLIGPVQSTPEIY